MKTTCPLKGLALAGVVALSTSMSAQQALEAPFTRITNGVIGAESGMSGVAAWGDFNNDGWLDLFVGNHSTEPRDWLFQNNADGTFTEVTTGPVVTDSYSNPWCASWADYDNDGDMDLFVTHVGGVGNSLFRNDGSGQFVDVTTASGLTDVGESTGAAWGDYDNDGFPDVLVTHGVYLAVDRLGLYRNHGNDNSWVKVRCVGTDSNRSAIGAKIRVKAKIGGVDRWQMRQIAGSEGWTTFNSLDALIGLGDATVIDTLRVEWPSGFVQEFHDVPVKQTLTIVERTDLSITQGTEGTLEMTIKGPRQQRYRVEESSDLRIWSAITSLTITNTDGTARFQPSLTEDGTQRFFRATAE